MNDICHAPFGDWAQTMRDAGFWPRPLIGKACKVKGWQTPDPDLPPGTTDKWDKKYSQRNIGLVMGSPFPDGTLLGALDIDQDDYVPLGKALLHDPPSGRIGKKGAALFVRITPSLKNAKFSVSGRPGEKYGQVLECMFHRSLIVIPPSIHPDTQQPYRWIGTPLHEIDYQQLPLIGE